MQQMPAQQSVVPTIAQPTTIQEHYLSKTIQLIKAVVPENPYYKNQVGTVIYEFVAQLKGDKAPKITGMLIDLACPEIQQIL